MATEEVQDFVDFIKASPTAWHAVEWMRERLEKHGYEELKEHEAWKLEPGKKYYVTRNGSSLCCFTIPKNTPTSACILGAHTDSPGLKLKPLGEFRKEKSVMLGVEVYGGPLLSSWLNRDLGLAGRIAYRNGTGEVKHSLVNLTQHPFVLPQLAIHLDRGVNDKGLLLNKQEHLPVLAALDLEKRKEGEKPPSYLEAILQEELPLDKLLGFDLLFYPLEEPRLVGKDGELLSAYRIDNLNGVHSSLTALLASNKEPENCIPMGMFWDHEEIGSDSTHGAGSPFLSDVLERIALALHMSREQDLCLRNRSLLASIDLAHAIHPNYADKHDPQHKLYLNEGIVLKVNARQRYASDATLGALIADLCERNGLKMQTFVGRTDMPTGSTIGPISAARTGIPTVDVGCPQLSMHSARELMACQDHVDMCKLLTELLNERV